MTRRLLAFALAAVAVLGVGFGASAMSATQAAWTDRTYVTAVATAGTWATTGNTCIAYTSSNQVLAGCRVTAVRYESWGAIGDRTRNYYVDFSAPSGTVYVTFDIGLGTATGGDATAMTWQNAAVGANPQFTARGGWTCSQLPRVQGRSLDWHTQTVYFAVHENKANKSTYCG